MLTINPEKVCRLVVLARRFDVKVDAIEPDPGSNAAEDDMREVLEDRGDDNVEEEIASYIRDLNDDEQVELVALAWLGRGSFSREEWADAVREARHARNGRTAEYLLGLPLLGDYLAEGLAEFGHSCSEEEFGS